jgi:hypothetical protein
LDKTGSDLKLNRAITEDAMMKLPVITELIDREMPELGYALPFSANVARDILCNVRTIHDYSDWDICTEAKQADLLREVIATTAAFKYDSSLSLLQNRSERLTQIEDLLETVLKAWAVEEGYPE